MQDTLRIQQVRQYALSCCYEQGHSEQVVKLSQLLFERLNAIHGLGDHERFLLTCGGILHDIGWINGRKGHHKVSMRMILDARFLPFDETERAMVALVARYHRKSPPEHTQSIYSALSPEQQKTIRLLSGILRIADGLDCSHQSVVTDIDVELCEGQIKFECKASSSALPEIAAAQKKADVFEEVSGYRTCFAVMP